MSITSKEIKELRQKTSAGFMDCKKALEEHNGDFEKAVEYLRKKGLAKAAKRADRVASEGVIELYNHGDGRVGVMVEVNCETDFVSRSEAFREFAHEIALQIAALSPLYITEEDIPEDLLAKESEIAKELALQEGKPENIVDRIVDGRVDKFKDEVVLLRQAYIRDDKLSIQEYMNQTIVAIGENLIIRRFSRWALGEKSN
ncbi:MAG: translation elongation factor Ts [Anaerolineales bacterium]|nr:translation elongation factor Ts [Chloroflexota bacterium]MBL6981432.1 translation elongation factor Ts [Anaerolineales bacterium]